MLNIINSVQTINLNKIAIFSYTTSDGEKKKMEESHGFLEITDMSGN